MFPNAVLAADHFRLIYATPPETGDGRRIVKVAIRIRETKVSLIRRISPTSFLVALVITFR